MRLIFKSNPSINPVFVGLGFLFATLALLVVAVLIYAASVVSLPTPTDAQIGDAVEDLQDTTAELQQTVDELRQAADDPAATSDSRLETIDETLSNVDERLDQIEQNLEESSQTAVENVDTPQDELLTTAGWVVGGLSILIAMLSGVVWWQRSRRRKRLHISFNTTNSPNSPFSPRA